MDAVIFNIQRMSLHDGPGVRTTLFFKGCSLRCRWCHNPESMEKEPVLLFDPVRCIGCGECERMCKSGARHRTEAEMVYEREKCIGCMACAEACYANAIQVVGKHMDTEEIIKEALKDKKMYDISGGGVTCSGGEPLCQPEALKEILEGLKKKGVHTAVDTAGNVPWESFEKVIPFTDLFLFDIKHWDEERHTACTGASNRRILENLKKLEKRCDIYIRIPVVKGINDGDWKAVGDLLEGRERVKKVELLQYHVLGASKYRQLGKREEIFEPPSEWELADFAEYLKKRGIPAVSRAGRD